MRKILPMLAVALLLAGCNAQEQDRMQESWDDPMKRLTPRQRTLVEMPATKITIDQLVELGEAFPSYATQKLELRTRERVAWDESKSDWDRSQLSAAEQMAWRLE
jgi:PBP1b-binding outer membrane lipoprotein LpoB